MRQESHPAAEAKRRRHGSQQRMKQNGHSSIRSSTWRRANVMGHSSSHKVAQEQRSNGAERRPVSRVQPPSVPESRWGVHRDSNRMQMGHIVFPPPSPLHSYAHHRPACLVAWLTGRLLQSGVCVLSYEEANVCDDDNGPCGLEERQTLGHRGGEVRGAATEPNLCCERRALSFPPIVRKGASSDVWI